MSKLMVHDPCISELRPALLVVGFLASRVVKC
jgi:hypothetical protein